MYRLLRSIFFLLDAEKAHYLAMNGFKAACSLPPLQSMLRKTFSVVHTRLVQEVFGLRFRNPVGLGAGFDKNARYLRELEVLGFGFVEIGTVTPRPQAGNPKPRLFRLKRDGALINRMGFNNDGMEAIATRLKSYRAAIDTVRKTLADDHRSGRFLVGGNIGKNKDTPNEEAWRDYLACFEALHPYVDFFVVNVSSPNTPGLRALQDKEALRKIFTELQNRNQSLPHPLPILLKIAPDLTEPQLDEVVALTREVRVDGLVATNTTISREGLHTDSQVVESIGAGGVSGKPLKAQSAAVLRYLLKQSGRTIPVIGSGGIFSGADAEERIDAGAALIELWTGFIYEGPTIVRNICRHLLRPAIR